MPANYAVSGKAGMAVLAVKLAFSAMTLRMGGECGKITMEKAVLNLWGYFPVCVLIDLIKRSDKSL